MGCVLSVSAHLYLALHYYPLKFGFATGQSLCNLNAKFDCDAVSASSFSALLGIPLAAWGAVFYLILFMLILMSWLEWTDYPERLKRWTVLLAGGGFAASVVMGGISVTMMHNYCIVCMGLYALSLIIFIAVLGLLREPFAAGLKSDLPAMWSESRGLLVSIALIPVLAFFVHKIFSQNLGEDDIVRKVNESVSEWQRAKKNEFVAKPSLVMGPPAEQAVMVLSEFADFRCGHCKHASYTLHAFIKAHPDVRFEFYSFPLDGACNEKIQSSSGLSCRLAAAVYCAEKDGKGWPMHDLIFNKQDTINGFDKAEQIDGLLANEVSPMGLNWDTVQRCIGQPETSDAVKAQAKQGHLVEVGGTPTIFANGKMLGRGHVLPVLQAVYDLAKKTPKN